MKIVVALGGNLISDASDKTESFENQTQRVATTAKVIADLIEKGHSLVLTHGNGPQVGSLLLQQQADIEGSINLPLSILGALTQGQIGVVLQHALLNEFSKRGIDQPVMVVPTTVIVDEQDEGFTSPSKPIGPFYSEEEFERIEHNPDHTYLKLSQGYRRVVPSPVPRDILEVDQIRQLLDTNLVIALGGGGTPAIRSSNILHLQDAVVDKDLASSLLANLIDADVLLILTNVEGVYRDFGTDHAKLLDHLSKLDARRLVQNGQLGTGSMKPKVLAGVKFKGETIITSASQALDALAGKAGTRIINS